MLSKEAVGGDLSMLETDILTERALSEREGGTDRYMHRALRVLSPHQLH